MSESLAKLIRHSTRSETQLFARLADKCSKLLVPRIADEEGLQTQIVQNGRMSRNVKELLANAPEIWATFKTNKRKRDDRPSKDNQELSNVPRKAPDPGQLEARDSPTKDSRSQMRSTLNERVITFVYDMGNPATMHQPVQRTLQLRTPDRDNQGRLRRHSLPLYSTPYGRTSENISANETGFV